MRNQKPIEIKSQRLLDPAREHEQGASEVVQLSNDDSFIADLSESKRQLRRKARMKCAVVGLILCAVVIWLLVSCSTIRSGLRRFENEQPREATVMV
jgi:hypothetical protein